MKIREMVIRNTTLLISYSAIMTVIVFIFTVVFSLYIPETTGFFNIGETGVYIAAITGGPIVGLIAGGFGSFLSDNALGYGQFAPATLIIKGSEGFITGLLATILYKTLSKKDNRFIGIIFGIIYATIIYILGTAFYLGAADISLGILSSIGITLNLSNIIWIIVSIISLVLIIGLSWKNPDTIAYIIATMIGGLIMILGYFLYEQYILGVAAIAEVPFNTMQMTIGSILSLSIIGALEKVWG